MAETGPAATVREETADGMPAVVGQGNLRYVAGWPDAAAAFRLLGDACAEAGLETLDLPAGLRVRDAGAYRFAFNYDNQPWNRPPVGLSGDVVMGTFPVPPGGVVVVTKP